MSTTLQKTYYTTAKGFLQYIFIQFILTLCNFIKEIVNIGIVISNLIATKLDLEKLVKKWQVGKVFKCTDIKYMKRLG